MTDAPLPWIVEIRSRLAEPAPRRLEVEGDRRIVVLPLFVDAGELWVMLIRRPEEIGSIVEVGLPGAEASGDADPWSAAQASAAMDLGLQEAQVLPLGTLDELVALDGQPTLTCVAAIPFPMSESLSETGAELSPEAKPRVEMLPVPVTALANPRLVEERFLEVEGAQRGLIVLHVGRHRIAGSTAEALQLLLERLELD